MDRHRIGRDLSEQLALGSVHVETNLGRQIGYITIDGKNAFLVRRSDRTVELLLRSVRIKIGLDTGIIAERAAMQMKHGQKREVELDLPATLATFPPLD